MASEKPTKILLSRTDMTKEQVAALTDREAWGIVYSQRETKKRDSRLQICFTGFGLTRKQQLSDLASKKNLKVVHSVTKKLDFLVGGDNAGPSKIEKAESQGVQFLAEDEYLEFVETGALPVAT